MTETQTNPNDVVVGIHIEKQAIDYFWEEVKQYQPLFYSRYFGLYKNNRANPEEIKTIDSEFLQWLETKRRRSTLHITSYLGNAREFWKTQPFIYDKSGLFWFWNTQKFKWEIVDETSVLNAIEKELGFGDAIVKGSAKQCYLEAFKRVGRQKLPENPPKSWVQFKDKIYDLETGQVTIATPDFFICNPIPWEIGESDATPVMDKLFTEWVDAPYVPTLYEIIAYCCLSDYPIHLIFCLIGSGRNGKTKFQQLLTKFIGKDNCTSTELDVLLNSRFESAKLFKKLVCTLGETNFGIMSQTSLLKRLVGQDMIGYEFKNKNPFDDYNYAKILINSNSLPSSEDTSEGFYRRWLIIDFANTFPEGSDILQSIPEVEYSNLANKVSKLLPKVLERHSISNQGSIEARQQNYVMASNPLPLFLEKCCTRDISLFCEYNKIYNAYTKFLSHFKRRRVSRKEFSMGLQNEGLGAVRTSKKINDEFVNGYFIEEVGLNLDWEGVLDAEKLVELVSIRNEGNANSSDFCVQVSNSLSCIGERVGKLSTDVTHPHKTPCGTPEMATSIQKGIPELSRQGVNYVNIPNCPEVTQPAVEKPNIKYTKNGGKIEDFVHFSNLVDELKSKGCKTPEKIYERLISLYKSYPKSMPSNMEECLLYYRIQHKLGTMKIVENDAESLLNTIKLIPKDNSAFIDEKFSSELVSKLKSEGMIAEYTKGTYSIVE